MSHLSWYFRTWLHWDKASSPQCLLSFIKMMEELLWNGNRDHNMGTILTLQADATLKQTAKKITRAVVCEPKREVWSFLWAWPMPPLKHVILLLNLEYITWAFFALFTTPLLPVKHMDIFHRVFFKLKSTLLWKIQLLLDSIYQNHSGFSA